MPFIFGKKDEGTWLNPETDVDQLHHLLKPFPADEMIEWEVGTAAREPKNDYPEIIDHVKTSRQGALF